MSEKLFPEDDKRVAQAEIDDEFHRVADERWARLLTLGTTVSLPDAQAHLQALSRRQTPRD